MRHDPACLRLHDGRARGVLADDPVHAHSGIEPSAGHTDQQNHHRPHSDAAQSHVDPARTDTSGSASLTRPNHPKATLPIDQREGPAGSCTGGFRTQAPETLHKIGHSCPGRTTLRAVVLQTTAVGCGMTWDMFRRRSFSRLMGLPWRRLWRGMNFRSLEPWFIMSPFSEPCHSHGLANLLPAWGEYWARILMR